MLKIKNMVMFLLAKMVTTFAPAASHQAFVGAGSAGQLCKHILRTGHRRVLVVTDKPLRELGIVDQAVSGFDGGDADLAFYDGVLPDPTFEQVAEGAAIIKSHGSEAVLAIGGGSSIDCAKIIAACAYTDEDPRNWEGFGKVKHEMPPVYVVPTTAGTGSEATAGAVISDPVSHEKTVLSGVSLAPAATALDPTLQLGLPPHITAATGMDALTHAIETYICRWDRGDSKDQAQRAIRLIFGNLRRAYDQGDDADAREAMALAAYYAGLAIGQVNVGNVHAIAHQLGGKYGIPHGLANAMVLPNVLEFCAVEAQSRLAELADLVDVAGNATSSRDKARAFIDAVIALRDDVGIPPASEKIRAEDYDYLIDLAVNEGAGYFSPKLMDKGDVRSILEKITA